MDIILDTDMKAYLIEVNHAPSLKGEVVGLLPVVAQRSNSFRCSSVMIVYMYIFCLVLLGCEHPSAFSFPFVFLHRSQHASKEGQKWTTASKQRWLSRRWI